MLNSSREQLILDGVDSPPAAAAAAVTPSLTPTRAPLPAAGDCTDAACSCHGGAINLTFVSDDITTMLRRNAGYSAGNDMTTTGRNEGYCASNKVTMIHRNEGYSASNDMTTTGRNAGYCASNDVMMIRRNEGYSAGNDMTTTGHNEGYAVSKNVTTIRRNEGYCAGNNMTTTGHNEGYAVSNNVTTIRHNEGYCAGNNMTTTGRKEGYCAVNSIMTIRCSEGYSASNEVTTTRRSEGSVVSNDMVICHTGGCAVGTDAAVSRGEVGAVGNDAVPACQNDTVPAPPRHSEAYSSVSNGDYSHIFAAQALMQPVGGHHAPDLAASVDGPTESPIELLCYSACQNGDNRLVVEDLDSDCGGAVSSDVMQSNGGVARRPLDVVREAWPDRSHVAAVDKPLNDLTDTKPRPVVVCVTVTLPYVVL